MNEMEEIPGYVWYQDEVMLAASEARRRTGFDRSAPSSPYREDGYKPRPPADPWWVMAIAVAMLLTTIAALVGILYGGAALT